MKLTPYIFIAIFTLLFNLNANAQEKIKWLTMQEAVELNRFAQKKFMIDVYTDWCGWCKRMDKETFSDSVVAAYVNRHFYAVKFDAETKETIRLGKSSYRYVPNGRRGYNELAAVLTKGKLSYPTIVYLDENLRHIEVDPGYKDVSSLLQMLKYVHTEEYRALQVPFRL